MRFDHGLRISILAVLASLTVACNSILGVEDVARNCHVDSEIELVDSKAIPADMEPVVYEPYSGRQVTFFMSGELSTLLIVGLYDDVPPRGKLGPGTYDILDIDDKFVTCGICVKISVLFTTPGGNEQWRYWASGQGSLIVTTNDSTGLVGSLHDLKFYHVTDEDLIIDDGCTVAIQTINFNCWSGAAPRCRASITEVMRSRSPRR